MHLQMADEPYVPILRSIPGQMFFTPSCVGMHLPLVNLPTWQCMCVCVCVL